MKYHSTYVLSKVVHYHNSHESITVLTNTNGSTKAPVISWLLVWIHPPPFLDNLFSSTLNKVSFNFLGNCFQKQGCILQKNITYEKVVNISTSWNYLWWIKFNIQNQKFTAILNFTIIFKNHKIETLINMWFISMVFINLVIILSSFVKCSPARFQSYCHDL